VALLPPVSCTPETIVPSAVFTVPEMTGSAGGGVGGQEVPNIAGRRDLGVRHGQLLQGAEVENGCGRSDDPPALIGGEGKSRQRGGAGLVRLAVPDVCLDTVAAFEPSYMTVALPGDSDGRIAESAYEKIAALAEAATVVGLGPGLGRSGELDGLVGRLYQDLAKPAPVMMKSKRADGVDTEVLNAIFQLIIARRRGPPDDLGTIEPYR